MKRSYGGMSLCIGFIIWGLSMLISMGIPGWLLGLWLIVTGLLLWFDK